MTFHFELLDPPCDVAFFSIIDGETLYNSNEKLSNDVKNATIRQIGWHKINLFPDWFTSDKALRTIHRVMQTMQCTIQYLQYLLYYKDKEVTTLKRKNKELQREVNASYEEVVELREIVTLYKLKSTRVTQQSKRAAKAAKEGNLACTLCGNYYPTKGALESHYRKRHKRSETYSAIAAAHSSVNRNVEEAKEIPPHETQDFRFSPPQSSPPVEESRNLLALREELSELRLAVARLVEANHLQVQSFSPSHTVGYPAPNDLPGVALSKTSHESNSILQEILSMKELINTTSKELADMKKIVHTSAINKPPLRSAPPPLQFLNDNDEPLRERSVGSWDYNISPMTQRSPSAVQRKYSDSSMKIGPPGGGLSALTSTQTADADIEDGFSSPRERIRMNDSDRVNDLRFSIPLPPTREEGDFRYNEVSVLDSKRESPRVISGPRHDSIDRSTTETSDHHGMPERSISPPMTHRNTSTEKRESETYFPKSAYEMATSPSPQRQEDSGPSDTNYSDYAAYEQYEDNVRPLTVPRTVDSSSSADSSDDPPPVYDVDSNHSSDSVTGGHTLHRTKAVLGRTGDFPPPQLPEETASSEYSYYTYTGEESAEESNPYTNQEERVQEVESNEEEEGEEEEEEAEMEGEEEEEEGHSTAEAISEHEVPIRRRSRKHTPPPETDDREPHKKEKSKAGALFGKMKLFGKKKK